MIGFLTYILVAVNPSLSHAGELRELYRSARMLAMGGAGVALADDDSALYVNPAGLAGLEDMEVHYATADVQGSYDIFTTFQNMSALKGFNAGAINSLMGKNIYARGQVTPSFVMPFAGVGLISDNQVALKVENQSLPQITLGYQTTNGIQVASGFPLNPARRHRTRTEVRFGIGGKVLFRRGGFRPLPLISLFSLSKETLLKTTGNFGYGIGVDLGSQVVYRVSQNLNFYLGSAFTEAGDVAFGADPEPQRGNLAFGTALQYNLRFFKVNVAYDYRRILDETDWRKKNHLGIELILPIVTIYAGINQVYLTYGAAVDLWLFKLTALTYAEEEGSFVHIDPDRRYMARFDFTLTL
ncbi:MAG: hypothetical protein AAB425_06325 [Bdellovibrionota bacterium]